MTEATTVRQRIEQVMADSRRTPATRSAEVARLRAVAAVDAFAAHPGRNLRGVVTVRTRRGEARLGRVELQQWPDGNTSVEVWEGSATTGPPAFRVFNPPTLAQDPRGDIVVAGKRYREDPLAALAEVVAGHRGRRTR